MSHVKLFILLFVCFLLQGTVFQVFSLQSLGYNLVAAPHFIVITLLYIGIFYSLTIAVRYAIIFGLLIDIIYTDVWGVYAFCITLTIYLMLLLISHFNNHLIIVILISMIATVLVDIEVYSIYTLIGIASEDFVTYTQQHLAPTLIINTVFAIIVYYPYRRFISGIKTLQEE